MTLEDEFESALADAYKAAYGKEPHSQWLTAIDMRAGSRGPVATLEEAGAAVGVTRERVRQVMRRLVPYLEGLQLNLLPAVAKTLAKASPVADPVGSTLAGSGMVRATLTAAGFMNMVALLGTSVQELTGTGLALVEGWLVSQAEEPLMKALSIARRHTGRYGLTTLEEVRQALPPTDTGTNFAVADIRRVLQSEPNVRWHGDWLWVEKETDTLHSNRLVNTARSILSVNSPQPVASIHEGARRLWKFRGLDILPPTDAMRAFFDASPHFDVAGNEVAPTEPLNYHDVLGEVSSTMVDVLKSSPYQVMDRQSLHEACTEAGIKPSTFGIWTTFAEWMERFAPNVWGLRGSKPSPAAVATVQRAARLRSEAEPSRKSWAWVEGGAMVQTMDVTTSLLNSGVLSFANEFNSILAGEALDVLVGGDTVTTAKVGANHSFSWGWFPALRALGVQHGDVLQIRVNVAARTALVTRGGLELWE